MRRAGGGANVGSGRLGSGCVPGGAMQKLLAQIAIQSVPPRVGGEKAAGERKSAALACTPELLGVFW